MSELSDLQAAVADLEGQVADLRESPPTDGFSETQLIVNEDHTIEEPEAFNEGDFNELFSESIDEWIPFEEKGDLLVADAEGNPAVLPLGEDGQVLTVDSGAPLGMVWDGPVTPPESNEGEELSADLAKWVTVHQVVKKEPAENSPEITFDYTPPLGTEVLVLVYVRHGPKVEGAINTPQFSGGAPDGSGSENQGAVWARLGFKVWENPTAGQISWAMDVANQSCMMLAISVKGQGGEPLILDDQDVRDTATTYKLAAPDLDLTFPGLAISAYSVRDITKGATQFSSNRVGTRVLKQTGNASGTEGKTAAGEFSSLEVCVAEIGDLAGEDAGYVKAAEFADASQLGLALGICEQEG